MDRTETEGVFREPGDVEYHLVDSTDGLEKGVVLGERDGTPNFSMRKFRLEAGGEVPRHTNEVEHVQYVLEGGYVVGMDGEERRVSEGDAVYVPAGKVHWYRNDGDTDGVFLCTVPNGDDSIELVNE